MKVVDEHLKIRDIEDKIAFGTIEELIYAAHNELKLLRLMKNWKPWEYLMTKDSDGVEIQDILNNMSNSDPFPAFDRFDDARWESGPRKESAGVHPETK